MEARDDQTKLSELRAAIAEGIADIDAGRIAKFDVEEFLAEVWAEFGLPTG